MEYMIVIILIVGVLIMVFWKFKNNSSKDSTTNRLGDLSKAGRQIIPMGSERYELGIRMEQLPSETVIEEKSLIEIADSKVLARINNLIPELAQVGNATNNTVQLLQSNGKTVYEAVIPAGVKLTSSKGIEGAVRGFYHEAGGIRHANFLSTEVNNNSAIAANMTSATMGVASVVVGQYYMNQINRELGIISEEINKISNFQNNEYKSKVYSLAAHVKVIADFQVEILDNNELRTSKIAQLDDLEEKCTELLGQANLMISDYTKQENLKYNQYEKVVGEIDKWYAYRNLLMSVLYKIADLKYTLHFGTISREQSSAIIPIYMSQINETQEELYKWHNKMLKCFKIDTSEIRRKRTGVGGVVLALPGKLMEDLNYKDISVDMAVMIEVQMEGMELMYEAEPSNLYFEDVHLISQNGKLFYMPFDN